MGIEIKSEFLRKALINTTKFTPEQLENNLELNMFNEILELQLDGIDHLEELKYLENLTSLTIHGKNSLSNELVDFVFPVIPSLKELRIVEVNNMESIDLKGVKNLEILTIIKNYHLKEIKNIDCLKNLSTIEIIGNNIVKTFDLFKILEGEYLKKVVLDCELFYLFNKKIPFFLDEISKKEKAYQIIQWVYGHLIKGSLIPHQLAMELFSFVIKQISEPGFILLSDVEKAYCVCDNVKKFAMENPDKMNHASMVSIIHFILQFLNVDSIVIPIQMIHKDIDMITLRFEVFDEWVYFNPSFESGESFVTKNELMHLYALDERERPFQSVKENMNWYNDIRLKRLTISGREELMKAEKEKELNMLTENDLIDEDSLEMEFEDEINMNSSIMTQEENSSETKIDESDLIDDDLIGEEDLIEEDEEEQEELLMQQEVADEIVRELIEKQDEETKSEESYVDDEDELNGIFINEEDLFQNDDFLNDETVTEKKNELSDHMTVDESELLKDETQEEEESKENVKRSEDSVIETKEAVQEDEFKENPTSDLADASSHSDVVNFIDPSLEIVQAVSPIEVNVNEEVIEKDPMESIIKSDVIDDDNEEETISKKSKENHGIFSRFFNKQKDVTQENKEEIQEETTDRKKKNITYEEFVDMGYSNEQLLYIRDGLAANVDVTYLANKRFSPKQMEVILNGLYRAYDVSIYANPDFDVEQMELILYGFNHQLDVSQYAKTSYSVNQMTYEIIKLMYPNITMEYQVDDFNEDQWSEIRMVMKQSPGINITKMLNPKFNSEQLSIIKRGLIAGVDVSQYAKPDMSADEMNIQFFKLRDKVKL